MTGASPFNDLSQGYVRKDVAKRIVDDIDAYAVATYDDGNRTHLGASLVGADCTRATWYSWRWMGVVSYSGRMQRLFQRGHLEELRFAEYVVGIGGTCQTVDPETGKQFRVSRLEGHFGGALDAKITLPLRYNCGTFELLGEFKTKGTGSGFNNLREKGIMVTNSQHYDQMSTYGRAYNYELSLYFTVNKNDDDLHAEIVPLSFKRAEEVERKADYIIRAQVPPPRIAQSPTFTKCKQCNFNGVCHFNHKPAVNCRSCQYAYPIADAEWFCAGYARTIPPEVIKVGCAQWTGILSQQ